MICYYAEEDDDDEVGHVVMVMVDDEIITIKEQIRHKCIVFATLQTFR